jgi:uncharacterized protein (DUF433 family)
MTIQWVKADPLVMHGEPFCYGSRLTVRNLLELRAAGLTPADIMARHPELRAVGIAEAYRYAAEHGESYADLLAPGGALRGPAFTAEEAAALPEHLRSLGAIIVDESTSQRVNESTSQRVNESTSQRVTRLLGDPTSP